MSEQAMEVVAPKQQSNRNVVQRDEAPAPAPVSETAAIVSMIERAARDPNVDIDKMERLMRMQTEMAARQAAKVFDEAMSAAQAEMPAVIRNAKNDHTKSKYAKLEAVAEAIMPVITKHGFSLSFGTEDSPKEGHYRVVCRTSHRAGHRETTYGDFPADAAGSQGKANKTAIQAMGSTITYGRRYLTLMVFNVALKDEDNDGNAIEAGGTITDEQVVELRDLIEAVEADEKKFCEFLKAESLQGLPAKQFQTAVKALQDFGRQRGKRV